MSINSDKPHLWKADVARSIHAYNDWLFRVAPGMYRKQRVIRTSDPLLSDLEKYQLATLKRWLLRHGYRQIASDEVCNFDAMLPGTFTIPLTLFAGKKQTPVKTSIACLVKLLRSSKRDQLFVIEIKTSGNTAITNRWRKKETQRFVQLKEQYGENIKFILLCCGYLDPGYLGYVGAEGIDWIWAYRLNDLSALLGGSKKQAA